MCVCGVGGKKGLRWWRLGSVKARFLYGVDSLDW